MPRKRRPKLAWTLFCIVLALLSGAAIWVVFQVWLLWYATWGHTS